MKNKTKGIRDSGSKEDEADTVYLLAKELAYDVVTGQTDNLAAALAKTSGKDIVQFAKAVEISHPNIDTKVCRTKHAPSKSDQYAVYKASGVTKSNSEGGTAICGDAGHTGGSISGGHGDKPQVLNDFVRETLKDGKNWPTSTKGTGSTDPKQNDNANAVAKDLVALNSDEKTMEWAFNISGL
ncbi:hypothetical protein [Anaplasma phagocytophilum]|uniref:hypothetical protein n=1 Tax=Anaplasma phagocytophilum TaxID=948 RepID=UPI00201033E9|nr:hypothetical protein [Anaplasma phagocytophilum]UQD54403.1 hypothetical protein ESP60_03470 [Anaplasma phagocytophilum]